MIVTRGTLLSYHDCHRKARAAKRTGWIRENRLLKAFRKNNSLEPGNSLYVECLYIIYILIQHAGSFIFSASVPMTS